MRSKHMAGISLAIMALGFIATLFLPENTAVYLLRGAFEAGLVGGIADWFAVTALFRHPLGIPIPHTSLLLRNKERIVQSLISAMENDLLNKRSIEDKLRRMRLLQTAASYLARLLRKRSARLQVLDFAGGLLKRLPIDAMVPALQSALSEFILRADAKTAADNAVTKLVNAGYEEKAFEYAIREGLKWVERRDTRDLLGRIALTKIGEVKASGLAGFAIQAFAGFMSEEKLGSILQNMLLSAGGDLLDRDNEHRQKIVQEIRVRLFELAGDEERIDRFKRWAADLARSGDGRELLRNGIGKIVELAADKLEEQKASGGKAVFTAYRAVVRRLGQDPAWVEELESRLLGYAVGLVEANHYRIGRLVKENVDRMDDASLVRMLEEKVGKDLQWIRVNGAVCGFAIGLILSLIQLSIG